MPTFRSIAAAFVPLAYYLDARRLSLNIAPKSTIVLDGIQIAPESTGLITSGTLVVLGAVPVYGGGTVSNPTTRTTPPPTLPPTAANDPALRRSEFLQVYPTLLNEFMGDKANATQMLATVCQPFDVVRRTDEGNTGLWVLIQLPADNAANWVRISNGPGSGAAPAEAPPALDGLTGGTESKLDGVVTVGMARRTVRKIQLGSLGDATVYMREAVLLENTSSFTTDVDAGRIVPLDAHPDTNNVIWILT